MQTIGVIALDADGLAQPQARGSTHESQCTCTNTSPLCFIRRGKSSLQLSCVPGPVWEQHYTVHLLFITCMRSLCLPAPNQGHPASLRQIPTDDPRLPFFRRLRLSSDALRNLNIPACLEAPQGPLLFCQRPTTAGSITAALRNCKTRPAYRHSPRPLQATFSTLPSPRPKPSRF